MSIEKTRFQTAMAMLARHESGEAFEIRMVNGVFPEVMQCSDGVLFDKPLECKKKWNRDFIKGLNKWNKRAEPKRKKIEYPV